MQLAEYIETSNAFTLLGQKKTLELFERHFF